MVDLQVLLHSCGGDGRPDVGLSQDKMSPGCHRKRFNAKTQRRKGLDDHGWPFWASPFDERKLPTPLFGFGWVNFAPWLLCAFALNSN
jgi:hypothetical protein